MKITIPPQLSEVTIKTTDKNGVERIITVPAKEEVKVIILEDVHNLEISANAPDLFEVPCLFFPDNIE